MGTTRNGTLSMFLGLPLPFGVSTLLVAGPGFNSTSPQAINSITFRKQTSYRDSIAVMQNLKDLYNYQ